MMKIGLISDTHGFIPTPVFDIFKEVDLIIHAGDIGHENVLTELRTIAPVKAVYGNVDGFPLVGRLSRIDFLKAEERILCVTHIVNSPKAFAYELFKLNRSAHIVIFGHTHRAEVKEYNNIMFVNPGSVSLPRGGGASVAILDISGKHAEVRFREVKK